MTEQRPVIFLHIGAMKTGTTFLQNLMILNRDSLAAAGYLFPGDSWARQVRAVQEVTDDTQGDPRVEEASAGAWAEISHEMLEHTGAASILSMEFLSLTDARHARRVVDSLRGAQVHVILTVRDATRALPAQWQTDVHNGSPVTWGDFMRGARKASGPLARLGRYAPNASRRTFLRAQDIPSMIRAWGRAVPPERMHVVTVPPPGSDPRLLWVRFASVVGVDPDVCPELPARANESLGYASTELLRRVNVELGQLPPTDYNPTMKQRLALRVLSQRSEEETRARMDRATYEFALGWNARTRRAILAAGVDLVGDLEDLPTRSSEPPADVVDDVQEPPTDSDLIAAATTAAEGLQRMVNRRARRLEEDGGEVNADVAALETLRESWTRSADPVAAATRDVAELARTAIGLQRVLRDQSQAGPGPD